MPGQFEAFERLVARFRSIQAEMRQNPAFGSPEWEEHGRRYLELVELENGEIAEWARRTKRDADAGDEEAKSILSEIRLDTSSRRFMLRGIGMPYEWTPRRLGSWPWRRPLRGLKTFKKI